MTALTNMGNEYRSELLIEHDYHSTLNFVNNILYDMDKILTSRQLLELDNTLKNVLLKYSVSVKEVDEVDIDYHEFNKDILNRFLEDKRLEGLSERSLEQYEGQLKHIFKYFDKIVTSITSDDLRDYFQYCIEERGNSKTTVDNNRRYLSSFFVHCVDNGWIFKNPLKKIEVIKTDKKIKKPFSDEEVIYLREQCTHLRDKAIFELLLSSGMRIGELVRLNRTSFDFENRIVIVKGKGDKEREVYFNKLAKVQLKRYFDSREDDNIAAFVSYTKPYVRLGINGAEYFLRQIGKKAGVNRVYPHRFRRTFATSLLNKGVTMEQIRQLLGHVNLSTTQLYAIMDDDELKYNHKRYTN